MYKDGWIASCKLDRIPWELDPKALAKFAPGVWDPEKDVWELYNTVEDFSQANDLAQKYPDKLTELKALFWEEAEKYNVYAATRRDGELLRLLTAGCRQDDEVHVLFGCREHRTGNDSSRLRHVVRDRGGSRYTGRRRGRRDRC